MYEIRRMCVCLYACVCVCRGLGLGRRGHSKGMAEGVSVRPYDIRGVCTSAVQQLSVDPALRAQAGSDSESERSRHGGYKACD